MKPGFGHNSGGAWRAAVNDCKTLLLQAQPGQTAACERISAFIGRKVTGRDGGPLRQALLELQREGIAFEAIKGVGYRRLDPDAAVSRKVLGFMARRDRIGRRGLKMSRAIDDASVSPSVRVTKWAQEAALVGSLRATHKRRLATEVRKVSLVELERQRLAAPAE